MNAETDIYQIMKDTLVLVLAGGQGSRLKELTKMRAKPVLEFGSHCRIIDFPLSNCVNSGLKQIAVLTQYKSQCLIRHLMQHWSPLNNSFGGRLDILAASQQRSESWYQGTADACYQNMGYIKSVVPKYVLILSGDHVYNMDYRKLLTTHVKSNAEMTVSCIEVPTELAANQLGVLKVDCNSQITAFDEKPRVPHALVDAPDYCLASMGNYVVNADVLFKLLTEDAGSLNSEHDFGKDVIPSIIAQHRVFAHRFRSPNGAQIPYWRDVGTLDSYWQAHMDLLNNSSLLNLSDPTWPIWGSSFSRAPTEITNGNHSTCCELKQVLVGSGCKLNSCSVSQSVLSSNVSIGTGSIIDKSVLLPEVNVGSEAKLANVIVDKGVNIPPNFVIADTAIAKQQGFTVTREGVILVTQKVIDRINGSLADIDNIQRFMKSSYTGPLPARIVTPKSHEFRDYVLSER